MNREEQIKKASKEYHSVIDTVSPQWSSTVKQAFIDGAEWADKHLDITIVSLLAFEEAEKDTIERACEWLEEHLSDYWSQKITNTDEFLEEFKKAMK